MALYLIYLTNMFANSILTTGKISISFKTFCLSPLVYKELYDSLMSLLNLSKTTRVRCD